MAHVIVQEPALSRDSSKGAMASGRPFLRESSKTFESAVEIVIRKYTCCNDIRWDDLVLSRCYNVTLSVKFKQDGVSFVLTPNAR
jgi:hypothetical protein